MTTSVDPWTDYIPGPVEDVVARQGDEDVDLFMIRGAIDRNLIWVSFPDIVTMTDPSFSDRNTRLLLRMEVLARAEDALAEAGYSWQDGEFRR